MTIPILPAPVPEICDYTLSDKGLTCPLVVDLPHGGGVYPPDFGFACPQSTLELCEEKYLDAFFKPPVLAAGGVVVEARFPRTYVDPNRSKDDVDTALFSVPWVGPQDLTGRAAQGHGVVMRLIRAGEPIYTRPLTHAEFSQRIDNYYSIYHNMLNTVLNVTHKKFGLVYHLNGHSTPSSALYRHFPGQTPDIVLGDRDGRSCGLHFRNLVAEAFKVKGFHVAINQLYKGAEIVRRYGDPARHTHSLQIEINRALFQNESTGEKSKNFNQLNDDVRATLEAIIAAL